MAQLNVVGCLLTLPLPLLQALQGALLLLEELYEPALFILLLQTPVALDHLLQLLQRRPGTKSHLLFPLERARAPVVKPPLEAEQALRRL